MKNVNNPEQILQKLKLNAAREKLREVEKTAIEEHMSYSMFLSTLLEIEIQARFERRINRCIKNAKLPFIKTLDAFQWTHPKKIDRTKIQYLFKLDFINDKENVVFIGTVGLGKTHLAIALAYHACSRGINVKFATAVDIINDLAAAHAAGTFNAALKKYTTPTLLCIDELGYIPIDKKESDLLFQVISTRYERGSTLFTTNRTFKQWPVIFNNDNTVTSAILDRLLHHCQVIIIEGDSFRMKDRH